MTLTRIFSRGAVGAATALISSALLVSAAFAQTPPFTIYGSDAGASSSVVVTSGDSTCGTATADADGQWSLRVESTCAAAGATVTATSGDATGSATAASGKATSVSLVAPVVAPVVVAPVVVAPAPAPSNTGMAGLVASGSIPMAAQTAAALATAFGALGAGFVTRRRS
jgi:VCBS repeat-containing protein|tara:strand:- start:104 stop:610 length:507 start_codon:yes stop_codon:yes gene_type:complete